MTRGATTVEPCIRTGGPATVALTQKGCLKGDYLKVETTGKGRGCVFTYGKKPFKVTVKAADAFEPKYSVGLWSSYTAHF